RVGEGAHDLRERERREAAGGGAQPQGVLRVPGARPAHGRPGRYVRGVTGLLLGGGRRGRQRVQQALRDPRAPSVVRRAVRDPYGPVDGRQRRAAQQEHAHRQARPGACRDVRLGQGAAHPGGRRTEVGGHFRGPDPAAGGQETERGGGEQPSHTAYVHPASPSAPPPRPADFRVPSGTSPFFFPSPSPPSPGASASSRSVSAVASRGSRRVNTAPPSSGSLTAVISP